jgi:hypothetical protein
LAGDYCCQGVEKSSGASELNIYVWQMPILMNAADVAEPNRTEPYRTSHRKEKA